MEGVLITYNNVRTRSKYILWQEWLTNQTCSIIHYDWLCGMKTHNTSFLFAQKLNQRGSQGKQIYHVTFGPVFVLRFFSWMFPSTTAGGSVSHLKPAGRLMCQKHVLEQMSVAALCSAVTGTPELFELTRTFVLQSKSRKKVWVESSSSSPCSSPSSAWVCWQWSGWCFTAAGRKTDANVSIDERIIEPCRFLTVCVMSDIHPQQCKDCHNFTIKQTEWATSWFWSPEPREQTRWTGEPAVKYYYCYRTKTSWTVEEFLSSRLDKSRVGLQHLTCTNWDTVQLDVGLWVSHVRCGNFFTSR